MKLKTVALGVAAAGLVAAEAVNLYKQVMGRGDRPKRPMTRLMEMKDKDDYAMADAWRQKYYLPPKGDSKVIVFGSHGFHADHTVDPHTFIKHYHDLGYGFFCCDHVGAGASGGEYVGFDYYESQDMLRWIEYLTARFGQDITVILHGVSMGAATVLQLAGSRCPDCVKLIISDCAYTSAKDEFSYVARNAGLRHPQPVLWLLNEMNKRLAGFDLEKTDVRQSVREAKVPILFIHGALDDFVPPEMVYELYNLCPADKKELKIFDNAKHAQSCLLNEEEYHRTVDDFIRRRLPATI